MRKLLIYLVMIMCVIAVLISCGNPPVSPTTDSGDDTGYRIESEVYFDGYEWQGYVTLRHWDGSTSSTISDAIVTINGHNFTHSGYYKHQFTEEFETGDILTLSVKYNGLDISETVEMPAPVATTSPVSGTEIDISSEIPLSWTYPTEPDFIQISINSIYSSSEDSYIELLNGSQTNHTVPGGIFSGVYGPQNAHLDTINETVLSGENIRAGSNFKASNEYRLYLPAL